MIAILVLALMILINGLLAAAEIALVSARRGRLQQWAREGDTRAAAALALAEAPTRFLSTVQVGITLIGILSGAFAEGQIADDLRAWLERFPALAAQADLLSTVVVVLAVTYLSLVFGELVPKRLGLHFAERLARWVAGPSRLLAALAALPVKILTVSTELVLRLLRLRPSDDPPVTESELKLLFEQATQAGVLSGDEERMLKNAVRLGDRDAGSLMTPRTEIAWLDLDDAPEAWAATIAARPHSRYPVARADLDAIEGVVQARDVLRASLRGESFDLATLQRKPLYVPSMTGALTLLRLFRAHRTHLALVIDEYGGLDGLVTLGDVLELIVGDIPEEHDAGEQEIVRRADGSLSVDGATALDDLEELLGTTLREDDDEVNTVAGLVMARLGRLPKVGDQATSAGTRFEVLDMDGVRVDRVVVTPPGR